MFAYCRDNPTSRVDYSGKADISGIEESFDDDVDVGPTDREVGRGGPISGGSGGPTYPQNPFDFNPNGLERRVIVAPGSGKNGGIIKWFYPGGGEAIFEWDEDWKIGSHYHAMEIGMASKHSGDHLWPNTVIDEPWRSIFFTGGSQ